MVVLSAILSLLVIVLLVIDIRFTLHNKRMIRRQISRMNKDNETFAVMSIINRISNEVELRKWCVDVVVKTSGRRPVTDNVIEAADKIHSYITNRKEGKE